MLPSFHVLGRWQALALRSAVTMAVLAAVVACRSLDGPPVGVHAPAPTLRDISDPLARIPVRQDVIKDAAPENAVVLKQADATKQDAGEAGAELEKVRAEFQQMLDDRDASIAALTVERDQARNDAERWLYKARALARLLSGVGLGVFLVVGFTGRWWGFTASLICGAVLAAMPVASFIEEWAVPIVGAMVGLGLLVLAYQKLILGRGVRDLTATGAKLIEKVGGMSEPLKAELAELQVGSTQKLVNRWQRKLGLRPA